MAEGGEPSVLIVEDEAALSTLLRYNLEREGYRVFEARDGEDEGTERDFGPGIWPGIGPRLAFARNARVGSVLAMAAAAAAAAPTTAAPAMPLLIVVV